MLDESIETGWVFRPSFMEWHFIGLKDYSDPTEGVEIKGRIAVEDVREYASAKHIQIKSTETELTLVKELARIRERGRWPRW